MIKERNNLFAILFGIAGVCVLIAYFVILPWYFNLKNKIDDFISVNKEYFNEKEKLNEIKNFLQVRREYNYVIGKMYNLFVDIKDPVEFVSFMKDSLSLFNLDYEISASDAGESELGRVISINLSVNGDLESILKFIHFLQNSDYLIDVVSFSIQDSDSGAMDSIIKLNVYGR